MNKEQYWEIDKFYTKAGSILEWARHASRKTLRSYSRKYPSTVAEIAERVVK